MGHTRRTAVFTLIVPVLLGGKDQDQQQQDRNLPIPPNPSEDRKLPNGKSQKDAIAKEQHEQALKDATDLIAVAEQLRDELQKAGNYVVPVASVKKTEEIEKLARRIRGRLKD
jgi:hypothetical protein